MIASQVISSLGLPASANVDKRVPKKLLVENGAPTAADKRQINDGIEELLWIAALKPTTIGVPEYRDSVREYLEIAVLSLAARPKAKINRLTELLHRAIPYPVVLVLSQEPSLRLSLAHKRWSQGEAGKTVLDGDIVEAVLNGESTAGTDLAFMEALALVRQPRATMHTLYQGWIDTMLAFQSSCLTGSFSLPDSAEQAVARRDALQEYSRLETQITSLRAAASKEKQMAKQVELNMQLQRLQAELSSALARL